LSRENLCPSPQILCSALFMERALHARATQAAQTSQSARVAQQRQPHALRHARAQRRAPRGGRPRALTTRSALARDGGEGTTASNGDTVELSEDLTAQALASKVRG